MNTKHFKDKDNNLFGVVIHEENAETWQSEIQEDWIEITIEDARSITRTELTSEEIKQREREEIEQRIQFLRNEIIYLTALDEDASEEIAESKKLRAQLKAL